MRHLGRPMAASVGRPRRPRGFSRSWALRRDSSGVVEDGSLEESGGGGESRARPGALHGLMDGVGLSSWRPDNWLRCRPRSRSAAASVLVFARVVRSLDFLGCRFLAASGRLVPFRWNRRGSGATRSFRTRGLASCGSFGRRHPPGLSRSGTLHHRRAIRRAAALGARVP